MKLNERQQQAAEHLDGPLLIIAGAGSGKTKVLIERIANLIKYGKSDPGEILAVTFTNKAARELKERLIAKIGDFGRSVTAGTFHSVCASILRVNADIIGYKPNFVIYDTEDKQKVLKEIVNRNNLDRASFPHKKISTIISNMKNKLIYPKDYTPENQENFFVKLKEIYSDYQDELVKCNAMDFDDLLCLVVELFKKDTEILFEYQNRLKYICVDEYQDTNYVQDLLIEMLSGLYNNVCVVGDEDQSIYSWRGADISNILNFRSKFKNCSIIQLEENYRSSENILKVANSVIAKNVKRLGKTLFTNSSGGEKCILISSPSDLDEGEKVVKIISGLINEKADLNDICILYRTNSQSRIPEENLRKKGIPYTIVGGVKFYERKEIKDLTAYLKLLVNDNDNISFERIINFPPRGIGKKSLGVIKSLAFTDDITYFEALKTKYLENYFNSKTQEKVGRFISLIEDSKQKIDIESAANITEDIFERSGLKEFYTRESANTEDNSKIDNLFEFLSSISEFVNSEEKNRIIDFLESVSLMSDIDFYNENEERVTLMTVHAAKGLEFENVIIIGMNEGLFPFVMAEDPDKLEEERRLFYVAVTRAKKKLYISTYVHRRRFFGDDGGYLPSRFLDGLPEEALDRRNYEILTGIFSERDKRSKYFTSKANDVKETFKKTDLVFSKQFGDGIIVHTEGKGRKQAVTVDFDEFGIKKLLVKYADLKKL